MEIERVEIEQMWEAQQARAANIHSLCQRWNMAHLPPGYQATGKTANPNYRHIDLSATELATLELEIRNVIIQQLKGAQALWAATWGTDGPAEWQISLNRWIGAGDQQLHDLILEEAWRW